MRRLVVVLLLVGVFLASTAEPGGARSWDGRYRVRPGDSLTLIAHRYRVSFQRLARVNRLDWRRPLLIGVVLRVPSIGRAARPTQRRYVVRVGDTLSGIAEHYQVSVPQLAAANGLDPAGVLLAGVRLSIPARAAPSLTLAHVVESDPYQRGAFGYDASYPNCSLRLPSADFAVIGLNGGGPFTSNPCFQNEWAASQRAGGVYVNTAYARTLLPYVSRECLARASRERLRPALRRAYALGCSEAEYDLRLLTAVRPVVVWLDVEPDNAWSPRHAINAATIRGILARLLQDANHPAIGIYSNRAFWNEIVGRWPSVGVPEWIAPVDPHASGCQTAFAAGPVWLSQMPGRKLDRDAAC